MQIRVDSNRIELFFQNYYPLFLILSVYVYFYIFLLSLLALPRIKQKRFRIKKIKYIIQLLFSYIGKTQFFEYSPIKVIILSLRNKDQFLLIFLFSNHEQILFCKYFTCDFLLDYYYFQYYILLLLYYLIHHHYNLNYHYFN